MTAAIIFFGVLLVLCLAEAGMLFLLTHPGVLRRMGRKLQNSMAYLYVQGERKVMPFVKGCGRYSPEFGYTLNPGNFVFAEREFTNTYFINSLGVRDSEEALKEPEIIVLGDSYALGWGVDQHESFAARVGRQTGLKVLNTAIPSFGTAREMVMLRRIDRSRLKWIILQYCGDDYDENLKYHGNGNRPQLMREETFHGLVARHSRPKNYFFGKFLWMKIQKRINEWKASTRKTESCPSMSEVDAFLHVLKQNEDILTGVPLVVFEMNGINQTNTFTTVLKTKILQDDQPLFIRNMRVIDMSQYLVDVHFYILDGHLTAEGHCIVADVLCRALTSGK